jgi:diguanylate cyclase (GGDEF)-like protein
MGTLQTDPNHSLSQGSIPAESGANSRSLGAPAQRLPILLVDDSAVARKLVEQALDKNQYAVMPAKTGNEALALFAEHRPGIVITDWLMPDLSGIELCERLRSEFKSHFTYIIMLTGISDKAKIVKGLQSGADEYVIKPFHPDELSARVDVGRRILELHREIEAKNLILEQLALTDNLTRLPNRRAIEEWGKRQLTGAFRHKFPFWVVMVDVNRFKTVNEAYGSEAADAVLKKVAEILKRNTRQCDICGRIDGDQFLTIMTFTNREGVQIAVERIREQIATQKVTFAGREVSVTASVGIAGLPDGQECDFARMMVQADVALRSAKRLGRDRFDFAKTGAAVCGETGQPVLK